MVYGRKRARACGTDEWIGRDIDEDSLDYKNGQPRGSHRCPVALDLFDATFLAPELKATCRAKIRRVKANLH